MSEFLINTNTLNIDLDYIQLYLQVIDMATEGKKYVLTDKADTLHSVSKRLEKNIEKTTDFLAHVVEGFENVKVGENGEIIIVYLNKEDFREKKDELIKVIQRVFSTIDVGYKVSKL